MSAEIFHQHTTLDEAVLSRWAFKQNATDCTRSRLRERRRPLYRRPLEHGICRGLYPGAGEALEVFLSHRVRSVGVDKMQRNFEPMQRQVEQWRQAQISDERAKLIFYAAFVEGKLDVSKSLLPEVHRLYFEPQYDEFSPRTMWSLSNAFTSAFKRLDPIPQFKATAKLGEFLNQLPGVN